ncbi:MAG: hypothetical protein A3K53_06400 [Deltaproteobacteria bacterium RIFOXYB2_FULL_66_7]|nr:MAG: hypothetical protein A3K53_06400 [Deltaproteobacteria bacterium RIFOXYB2_FULL_66_7]
MKDSDRKYHVVAYQLADGVLELKTLNTDLVPGTLTSSAELVKAIQANLANPELFKDPGKFRKVAKE